MLVACECVDVGALPVYVLGQTFRSMLETIAVGSSTVMICTLILHHHLSGPSAKAGRQMPLYDVILAVGDTSRRVCTSRTY